MNYTIRPASISDISTIQFIAEQTWPSAYGDILSKEQISYMLDMMYCPAAQLEQRDKGHVFLLLLEDSEPMGFVSYQFDYQPGTTKIHKIYVLPITQGKGYGKALLVEVRKLAQAAGQARLRLDVNYRNKALGFYEYLGFEKVGRFDTDIGNGYLMEDYIMEMVIQ
ncbi:MAG: GNAT family N-acetyltransferase [Bacteroidota bacterium]